MNKSILLLLIVRDPVSLIRLNSENKLAFSKLTYPTHSYSVWIQHCSKEIHAFYGAIKKLPWKKKRLDILRFYSLKKNSCENDSQLCIFTVKNTSVKWQEIF
jgi:hypothetical protein